MNYPNGYIRGDFSDATTVASPVVPQSETILTVPETGVVAEAPSSTAAG